jgi:hypothetical protein
MRNISAKRELGTFVSPIFAASLLVKKLQTALAELYVKERLASD